MATRVMGRSRGSDTAVPCPYGRSPSEFVQTSSEGTDAYTWLRFVLDRQNKLEEAVSAYRRATELDPEYTEARHNLTEIQRLFDLE
ncbi:tetratricopeptide repeat protein [Oxynema sp. CENA135]|uniref:tetratricopeptide repeat protein n=1 Tax=Oxynema sp. CENA135 TaxID=984206 RepID=UPI00190B8291|nr:tetratricopeptide repeat protein [Oxynema sp. CENA135]MBK4731332.1 tetratricopeptide repeat protein [Oxynema sp. CENA135]